MSKVRNANVEILRIIAMLFIITHHLVINGLGLQAQLKGEEAIRGNYSLLLCAINSIVIIGVNIFFLISGYYGIKFSLKKLLRMVLDVYIYGDILILISIALGMEKLNIQNIKFLIFPFFKYWFVIVYLMLFILSPVINAGMGSISKQKSILLVLFLTIVNCIIGYACDINCLGLNNGYSLISAMYLYCIGRVMNKHSFYRFKNAHIWIWLISTAMTILGCVLMFCMKKYGYAWKLFSYNQFFIVLASVNFVYIFFNMPYKKKDNGRFSRIAKHTLPVYYIHTCTIGAFYRDIPLKWAASNLNTIVQVLFLAVYAIIIYIICMIIDMIKILLLDRVEKRIIIKTDSCINKIVTYVK